MGTLFTCALVWEGVALSPINTILIRIYLYKQDAAVGSTAAEVFTFFARGSTHSVSGYFTAHERYEKSRQSVVLR